MSLKLTRNIDRGICLHAFLLPAAMHHALTSQAVGRIVETLSTFFIRSSQSGYCVEPPFLGLHKPGKTRPHEQKKILYTYTYIYIYAHTFFYIYISMYTYVAYMSIYVHICVYMCIYIYTHVYRVCTCIYIYRYAIFVHI